MCLYVRTAVDWVLVLWPDCLLSFEKTRGVHFLHPFHGLCVVRHTQPSTSAAEAAAVWATIGTRQDIPTAVSISIVDTTAKEGKGENEAFAATSQVPTEAPSTRWPCHYILRQKKTSSINCVLLLL